MSVGLYQGRLTSISTAKHIVISVDSISTAKHVVKSVDSLQKIKWLYACVKTLIALEQKTPCEDQRVVNKYEEITEDIFGYIGKVEDEEKYLF